MTGAELFTKIGGIDQDLIIAAERTPVQRKRVYVRWIAAAAACMLLLGISAYAVMNTYYVEKIYLAQGSGYSVTLRLPKISQNRLTGKIANVPAIIKDQYENYQPWSSRYPGAYTESFASPADAVRFVGFDGLRVPYFPYDRSDTTVTVMGSESGALESVIIETSNLFEDVRVTVYSYICTRGVDEFKAENIYPENGLDYTWSELTTGSGGLCRTVASSSLSSGYKTLAGYIVKDSVLYQIHLSFKDESSNSADAILCKWAEQL